MGGQHDLKKHQLSIKFPHPVWRQIEKAAEARGYKKAGVYIRDEITLKVSSIPLTAEDAILIASRIAEAEHRGQMV